VTACVVVIDLHSHILPRVDDGPARDDESVEMARLSATDGVRVIACTPHRSRNTPTTPERVAEGIATLQPAIDAAGIDVRLVPGLEITIEQAAKMDEDELRAASLGGGGRWLLIEMPFQGWPLELPDLLTALEVRGFGAVIAHPERAQAVQSSPDRMREIVGRGALLQLTAGSISGENGPRPLRAATQLLRAGFVHVIASDMHSPTWRPPGLTTGLDAAAEILRTATEDVRWMVDDVPYAIVEGREVRPPKLGKAPVSGGSLDRRRPADGPPGAPATRRPTPR
jgi:protein-tyrosine phosphatase